jgi:N6-adenosine-specific RNA methylase IME4
MAIRIEKKPTKLQKQVALLGTSPNPVKAAAVAAQITGKLPGMIRDAADKLSTAVSAAEVLDARDMAGVVYTVAKKAGRLAKVKGAHDKVVAAAHRAQADALNIEAEAKRRLADEYDGAQSRGEVGKRGQRTDRVPVEEQAAKAEDIGLTRKEVMDSRQVRDAIVANPASVREALDHILSEGDEPTRAALKRELAPVQKKLRAENQQMKKARRAERETVLAENIKALPDAKFGVIVADPEWEWKSFSEETGMDRAAANHYPTSTTDVIAQRDVASIAAKDCVLFLWATAPKIEDALIVMREWGFTYKSQFVWVKDKIGTGYWNRNRHEILLVGTRGDVPAPAMGEQWDSVIEAPVGAHSAKPEKALELIEAYFPNLPKCELNHRGPPRSGWVCWGNESEANHDAS